MKRALLSLILTVGASASALATLPPRDVDGTYHTFEDPSLSPERQLVTVRDVESMRMRQSMNMFRTYNTSATADGLGTYGKPCPTQIGAVKSIGEVTLPVILVEFSDVKLQETTTIEKISRQLNEKGYSDVDYIHGTTKIAAKGSVRDYFLEQSEGMFSPTFEVVAKVSLPNTQAYYFADKGERRDNNTYAFFQDAITSAQKQGVDFSKYVISGNASNYSGATTDGVPMVSFICAGYSEAAVGYNLNYYMGDATGLDQPWPHFARLPKDSYSFGREYGGIKFMSYFLGCELTGVLEWTVDANGKDVLYIAHSHLAGPGTFVHEFGHALGLPDFYAVGTNDDVKSPKFWSMMDSGPYYNDGYSLIGYTAYERALCGWLKYQTLGSNPKQCTLYSYKAAEIPEDGVRAFVIKNPSDTKEYYMLENRRADDVYYPKNMGNGMLVYHVHFDYNSWESNMVNSKATAPRYTVVPADGTWQDEIKSSNYKNDLFPGVSGYYKSLTDDSKPQAAIAYSGSTKRMRRPIYNITRDGELLHFDYLTDFTAEGISTPTVENDQAAGTIYDLSGRQIANPAQMHGLYISGQKKHFVK